jgi:uncharacterized protein YjbI with pentapeptide repeats
VRANLQHAILTQANLSRADLRGADLCEADFDGANLCGADLTNTVGLTKKQVESATIDEKTRLPDYLRDLLLKESGLKATADEWDNVR